MYSLEAMTTTAAQPKQTLAEYSPDEVASIVATRCQELSKRLGWTIAPPAVKIVDPDELQEAMDADMKVRAEKARGRPMRVSEEGLLTALATWLLGLLSPSVLGYFGTAHNTLYLNGELAVQQAGYVFLHELVHAGQWQRHPGFFAALDTGRATAEDLSLEHGDDDVRTLAARDRYESLVTLAEGHATHHARKASEDRIAKGAPQLSPAEVQALVTSFMGLDPNDENTALLYVRGEKAVAEMSAAEVEAMFQDPDKAVAKFTRRTQPS